jgi:hypothetical protein
MEARCVSPGPERARRRGRHPQALQQQEGGASLLWRGYRAKTLGLLRRLVELEDLIVVAWLGAVAVVVMLLNGVELWFKGAWPSCSAPSLQNWIVTSQAYRDPCAGTVLAFSWRPTATAPSSSPTLPIGKRVRDGMGGVQSRRL